MNIGAICNHDAITVCATATLAEAARLLCDNHIEAIVAVTSPVRRPTAIGVITPGDILTALLAHGGTLEDLHVLEVLARNPLVLHEEEEIDTTIRKLRSHGARHAPVVGAGGTLLGLISLHSLLNRSNTGLSTQGRSDDVLSSIDQHRRRSL